MLGLLAEQAEYTEAEAASLDDGVAADYPGLGQTLQVHQRRVLFAEIAIRGNYRRYLAGLGSHADRPAQAVRPEVEFMVAKGGGVVAHHAHEFQFAADLAGGGGKGGPHAVVARIQHQHRPLAFARFLLHGYKCC